MSEIKNIINYFAASCLGVRFKPQSKLRGIKPAKKKQVSLLKVFSLFFLFLCIASVSKADLLITNSGRELKGEVKSIDSESVTIIVNNEEKVLKKGDILRIDFTKDISADSAVPLSALNDTLLSDAVSKKVAPADYPNAGYIKLYSERQFTYTKEGAFIATYREIRQILQERGKNTGIVTFAYKKGVQTAKVDYGRTVNDELVFKPENAKNSIYKRMVTDYDQSSYRESSYFYRYPDYDKMMRIKFPLPNIVVGSVIDYQFTVEQRIIDTFEPVFKEVYFSSNEPVLKQRLIIRRPKDSGDLKISSRLMGQAGSDFTYTEKEDGEYTVITYEKENIKPVEDESYMPSDEMIMPRVIVSLSPNLKDIAKAYSRRLERLLFINDEIRGKLYEILIGADGREDKVFRIYDYISKEISEIPISPEYFSYLPKKSDYIFSKKSGSSIDKVFMLYAFLQAADIACDFALVRDRNAGGIFMENQSIRQFGYPVIIVPLDITTLYITALDRNLTIRDIDSYLQGGEYIIVSGDTSGEVRKLPLRSPERESISDSYEIELFEDGGIMVLEKRTAAGNKQGSLRRYQYMPKKNLRQAMVKRTHRIHPNAELKDYKFKNLSDLSKAPEMEIKYSIDDYMISAGDRLFAFQLPSLSYSAYGVAKSTRKFPVSFGLPIMTKKSYTIKLPKNYKIYYMPDKFSYKSDNFTYEAAYEANGDTIVFKDSYKRADTFMPKEAYYELKKCLETRADVAKGWIVIEREPNAPPN